jgi:hypothetical protein
MPDKAPKHSRAHKDAAFADFIERATGEVQVRVEETLGDGFVRLRTAEAEARQAKHDIRHVEDIIIELLRNSRDAAASHIFVASGKNDQGLRTLSVIDDGSGVPQRLQDLIFEPRVTSKLDTMVVDEWGVHGRGMALFSIRSNCQRAEVLTSAKDGGTALLVQADTTKLPERSDQSTLPKLTRDDQGAWQIGAGPHNIVRQTIEFALPLRNKVTVYLGSAAEIAATLLDYGSKRLSQKDLLFCDDQSKLPVVLRLAATADAAELASAAKDLGLDISERTAYRILQGQILPLQDIVEVVKPHKQVQGVDIFKDARGLKLSKEDYASFARALERSFQPIADRYYVSLKRTPKITVRADKISVQFQIDKL